MNVQKCQCSETADRCGNGCQTVVTEVSNRRARMGSVWPSMVNVQGSQCSERADLCGKGCQSVVPESHIRSSNVCSELKEKFGKIQIWKTQINEENVAL